MTETIDPVQAWKQLHPKLKEQIGAAAVALGIGVAGVGQAEETRRFDVAAFEAAALINALVEHHVLRGKVPSGVDLVPLGIRQCRSCGCTDSCGCDEGCHWVETDLCSACQVGKQAHGG